MPTLLYAMQFHDELGYVTETDFLSGVVSQQISSRRDRLAANPALSAPGMIETGVIRAIMRRAPLHDRELEGKPDGVRALWGPRMPQDAMAALMQRVDNDAGATQYALSEIILQSTPTYMPRAEKRRLYERFKGAGNTLMTAYRPPDKLSDPSWQPVEMVRLTGVGAELPPRYMAASLQRLAAPLRAFCERVHRRAASTLGAHAMLNPVQVLHYEDDTFEVREAGTGIASSVHVPSADALMLRVIVAGLYPACQDDAGVRVEGMPTYHPQTPPDVPASLRRKPPPSAQRAPSNPFKGAFAGAAFGGAAFSGAPFGSGGAPPFPGARGSGTPRRRRGRYTSSGHDDDFWTRAGATGRAAAGSAAAGSAKASPRGAAGTAGAGGTPSSAQSDELRRCKAAAREAREKVQRLQTELQNCMQASASIVRERDAARVDAEHARQKARREQDVASQRGHRDARELQVAREAHAAAEQARAALQRQVEDMTRAAQSDGREVDRLQHAVRSLRRERDDALAASRESGAGTASADDLRGTQERLARAERARDDAQRVADATARELASVQAMRDDAAARAQAARAAADASAAETARVTQELRRVLRSHDELKERARLDRAAGDEVVALRSKLDAAAQHRDALEQQLQRMAEEAAFRDVVDLTEDTDSPSLEGMQGGTKRPRGQ